MNKINFFIFCVFLCSSAFADKIEKSKILDDFLAEVISANLNIRSSFLRAQAFKYKILPSTTLEDPFFAFGVDQVAFDGSMGSVTRYQISQSLPFPGKLNIKSNIAENRALSAMSDAETTKREIYVIASQIFYRAYYNQQALEYNQKIKKIIESTIAATQSAYKTGAASHHDWLLAKIELNLIEVEKLKLLREKESLLANLNELRNQPADSIIGTLDIQFLHKDQGAPEVSLDEQPELKSLSYSLTQIENETAQARRSYFPDFVIQGMSMYPSPEMMNEKSNWGVMIGMNIPLYFWRKQSEQVSAATKDFEAATLERKNLENKLHTEMIEAQLQFKTALDVVSLYKNTILPTTNLAVESAKSNYATKRLPISSYLEALKIQRAQELEFLAAQIDVELAQIRIKNLLSSPPIMRFTPLRPSLFGSMNMDSMSSVGSDTVNMGRGMSGPSRKSKSQETNQSGSGMGNM